MSVGFAFVVYGDGGVGKSWEANTAPGPRLFLDVEGRSDNLPGKVVRWDGKGNLPKVDDDTTVVVSCPRVSTLNTLLSWLSAGKLNAFKTIIIDSLSFLQQVEIDETFDGQMQKQHWGQLLKLMSPPLLKLLRHLKREDNPLECVVLTCWHKEYTVSEQLRIKPFIDGQLQQRISHLTDVVGFLTVQRSGTTKTRKLQIEPTGGVTAKNTYSALDKHNGYVTEPNITQLIEDMKGSRNV